MFDTYITRKGDHGTTIVHEHRAPTDESVRLLRELEKAAADRVLQAFACRSAIGLEVTVLHEEDFSRVGGRWSLRYRIHGTPEVTVGVEPWTGAGPPDQAWVDGLLDVLAKSLASKIGRIALTGRLK